MSNSVEAFSGKLGICAGNLRVKATEQAACGLCFLSQTQKIDGIVFRHSFLHTILKAWSNLCSSDLWGVPENEENPLCANIGEEKNFEHGTKSEASYQNLGWRQCCVPCVDPSENQWKNSKAIKQKETDMIYINKLGDDHHFKKGLSLNQ